MTTSEKIILLVDADGDCEELASAAAARNGWEAKWVKTSREAFALLKHRLSNFAVVLVDVDPGAHGLALLEAISGCGERPPMIVLTALEESYMNAIACEHGAAHCLSKPISSARLSVALRNVCSGRISTCDHWGHLVPTPIDDGSSVKTAVRGIVAKLSAAAPETASKRKRNKREARQTATRA
jgi:DNA-binding NtrC family response regulator